MSPVTVYYMVAGLALLGVAAWCGNLDVPTTVSTVTACCGLGVIAALIFPNSRSV